MAEAPRVLVVDEDPFLQLLLSRELPAVELIEAHTAEEGYDLALREKPDAIFIDIRLPDGDGMDLLRRLRHTGPLTQTPMLVITAGFDEANRADVLHAGADEYLPKPIEGADLLRRLERILSVEPGDRKERRQHLLARIRNGVAGDPDPVPLSPTDPVDGGDGGLLRRLFRRS